MAPAAFVSVAAIPLSANGKVDRRALERIEIVAGTGREYVGPRNQTEKQLVEIWAEVLKLAPEKIGINDGFFDLGGHSLSAVQLMAKIDKRFGQMLPLAIIFTAPNIAALATLLASNASNEEALCAGILVPIQTNGSALPIFAVPGAGGNVLSLQPLSEALGSDQPFYGLQAAGLDGKTLPLNSIEETAKANITALKTIQPCGPYSLMGHSYGGVVAFEMARILLEREEKVSSLVLIDSVAPSVMQNMQAEDEAAELFAACTTMASLYSINLSLDLNRLRELSTEERFHYFADLLNKIGVEINAGQFAAFLNVYRANQACYRGYMPALLPVAINVSLYRAIERHQHDAMMPHDYGWNQLLQTPLRIYDVEADHFSILKKDIFKYGVENSQHQLSDAKAAG
jgi:thioesterase domain-containing protein/acyl carrier protein